ncbi:hypothetical protein BU14_0364s0005 [Porphyra umbilicalis]|uniref:AB hydrolase-1 domain-containing protein n=1 Tax=Porphyra umbilicalis TaxID=2786 RepID=A0A1X6NXA7_PORUM|nr:hypothetical protein BU14_0364s0005 [Porphyra umbilicalis]|eukprot:OSX73251.1 hypothetical protein BU14_0364s0005 [Porphyra umbilicalis]
MDDLGVPSAAVVGHSLGGKVAMHMALTAPARVAALTVVDIAPRAYPPPPPPPRPPPCQCRRQRRRPHPPPAISNPFAIIDVLASVPLDAPTSRAAVDARLAAAGVSSERTRAFVLTNLRPDAGRAGCYHWRVNLAALAAAREELSGWAWPPAAAAAVAGAADGGAAAVRGGAAPRPPAHAVYRGPAVWVRGADSGRTRRGSFVRR